MATEVQKRDSPSQDDESDVEIDSVDLEMPNFANGGMGGVQYQGDVVNGNATMQHTPVQDPVSTFPLDVVAPNTEDPEKRRKELYGWLRQSKNKDSKT